MIKYEINDIFKTQHNIYKNGIKYIYILSKPRLRIAIITWEYESASVESVRSPLSEILGTSCNRVNIKL